MFIETACIVYPPYKSQRRIQSMSQRLRQSIYPINDKDLYLKAASIALFGAVLFDHYAAMWNHKPVRTK